MAPAIYEFAHQYFHFDHVFTLYIRLKKLSVHLIMILWDVSGEKQGEVMLYIVGTAWYDSARLDSLYFGSVCFSTAV